MDVIIPTYRRTGSQHTFASLGPLWRDKVFFVVDQRDYDLMANQERYKPAKFVVVPEHVKSIAQKRAWILETWEAESIVMMDDDLRFAVRKYEGCDAGNFKLVAASNTAVDVALCDLEEKLKTYAHAGFSARQGNNRKPLGWEDNTRMMYVLGYQPATVRQHCILGRIETREDFDYTLQLLRKGFHNTICNEICTDQKYNAAGGASLERTVDSSNADATKLAELHPGFVKVVQKDYVGSVQRQEVIVQWKKATEEGNQWKKECSA
jgi:hypothetical protein